jgi:Cu/Ag efflux protein CusF
MIKRFVGFSLLASAALASPAWSQGTAHMAKHGGTAVMVGSGPNGVGGAIVNTERATITAIDPATRSVTLQSAAGETHTIHAGEAVSNFNQLKVGDQVVLRQTQALLLGLRKVSNGIRERTEWIDVQRDAPGGRPGITARHVVEAVANVTAIDMKAGTVTLRGVRESRTLHVDDRALLSSLKVGDQVEATVVDQDAISIEPPRMHKG